MVTKPTPRHLSTVTPPPAGLKASDLPELYVGPGTEHETVFRAHSLTLNNKPCDARYYASSSHNTNSGFAGGRFDLPYPAGTCNTAANEYTAFRERIGRMVVDGFIPETFLSNTLVTELRIKHRLLLADFSKPGPGYIPGDITGPLPGEDGYHATQLWAEALKKLGFDGIIARARHNDGYVIYLFGSAGVQEDLFDVVGTRLGMDMYWEMSAKGEFLPKLMASNEEYYCFTD